jgi:hypothetical protein
MGEVRSFAAARRAARREAAGPAPACRSLEAIRRMMPTLQVAIAAQDVLDLKGLAGLGGPLPVSLAYILISRDHIAAPHRIISAA